MSKLLKLASFGAKIEIYDQNIGKTKLFVKTPTQPQPNITLVGLDLKMALHTPPHKLNVSNISAITDQILMKL